MPSETKDHVAHQQHPHEPKEPGEVTFTKQEAEDGVKNKKVEEVAQGNEKESEGVDNYEQVEDAKKEGMVSLSVFILFPFSTSGMIRQQTAREAGLSEVKRWSVRGIYSKRLGYNVEKRNDTDRRTP
jgi:hypothetical protein